MSILYECILNLCNRKNITGGKLCAEIGIQRSLLTDLKMGRKQSLSAETLKKIADYFDVSVDYLLTGEETEKAPSENGAGVTDDDIKIALFGGAGEVTDAMWEEALNYAQYIKERERKKQEAKNGRTLQDSQKK